jgi:hypothetical protein
MACRRLGLNWRDATAKQPHFVITETPRYVGRAVAHLAGDLEVARWSGQSLSSGQLLRSMASLIWMGLSPMLGATFVRSRMPANLPMRPDTGNIASPTLR